MNEKYFILFNARQSDVAEEKQLIFNNNSIRCKFARILGVSNIHP